MAKIDSVTKQRNFITLSIFVAKPPYILRSNVTLGVPHNINDLYPSMVEPPKGSDLYNNTSVEILSPKKLYRAEDWANVAVSSTRSILEAIDHRPRKLEGNFNY